MNKTAIVRKTHRWMSLIIGIQILFWILGGLYFSLIPIETIRGEHFISEQQAHFDTFPTDTISASTALNTLRAAHNDITIEDISIISQQDQFYYRIKFNTPAEPNVALIHVSTGQLKAPVDQQLAEKLALGSLKEPGEIQNTERITSVEPDSEYRGKALPAWRINIGYPSVSTIYISEQTGELTSVRTDAWRFFDFLWMLHILDFDSRDNYNHWFLTLMSALALITVLSGFLLWMITTKLFRS